MVYRCGALALVVAACCLAPVSPAFAEIDGGGFVSVDGKQAGEPRHSALIDGAPRSGRISSRTSRIGMDEATQTTRRPSLYMMAPLAMLLGIGVIGCRLYGRRQGIPAT
jgi:hypothetical protein